MVEVVTARLKHFFNLIKDDKELYEIISKSQKENDLSLKHQQEKIKIEKKLEALTKMTLKIYQDNATGLIDDSSYARLVTECQNDQKALNVRLIELNKLLEKTNTFKDNLEELKEVVNEFLDFKELTREMVCKLITRIEIAPVNYDNGGRTQEITLVYRFINIAL